MTDYNWTIVECERESGTGGIILARWRLIVVDGGYSASSYGACGFAPDPTASGFTPYDEVTEAQVLGWCWNGGLDKAVIEASLEAQIEAQKTPVTLSGLPW